MNSSPPSDRLLVPMVSDDLFDLERLWTIVRRNLWLIASCVAAALFVGLLYLRAAPPVYASQTRVFLDDAIGSVAIELQSVGSQMQLDSQIASQIEVLRSNRLALEVVDALDLTNDQVFLSPPASPLASVLAPVRYAASLLRGSQVTPAMDDQEPSSKSARPSLVPETAMPQDSEDNPRTLAASFIQQNLEVARIDRSSVISLTYFSHDPALAFRIVRAYTAAFVREQRQSLAEVSIQATSWMEKRLTELGDQQRAAALAVEEFRSRNNLSVARGEFVSEQRLSDLTSQIALAQSELAQAQARSQQIDSVLSGANKNDIAAAAIALPGIEDATVQELLARYVQMSGRISQISADFGVDHPQAVKLSRDRKIVSDQLVDNLKRVAARYSGDATVARNRLNALESTAGQQTSQNAGAGGALVRLRELEQEAETLAQIYRSFLTRYEEAVQRQSFPVSNFRVISDPVESDRPVGPRFARTMAIFAFLGVIAGSGIGALREFSERSYRTGSQLSDDLGVRFFGYLGALPSQRERIRLITGVNGDRPLHSSIKADVQESGRVGRRLFALKSGVLARRLRAASRRRPPTADTARTISAETLRNAAHVFATPAGAPQRSRVIGVISALPEEGKTTVAMGLANLLSRSGYRVIILDADLRQPAIKDFLTSTNSGNGLAEAIRTGEWRKYVVQDKAGTDVLPTHDDRDGMMASTLLGSNGMSTLVRELSEAYDYVVLDLPPASLVVDAKVVAPLTDGLLLVVRWGSTSRVIVRTFLAEEPEIASRISGAVLNATEMRRLRRYGERGSREHVYQRYGSYYRNAE